MKRQRKNYTAEEKVAILRRHLLEKVPISDLCEEYGLHPTMFYRWQKDFFENGAMAFQQKARPNHQAEQERIVPAINMISGIVKRLSLGAIRFQDGTLGTT